MSSAPTPGHRSTSQTMLHARSFAFVMTRDGSAGRQLIAANLGAPIGARRFVSSDANAALLVWDVLSRTGPDRPESVSLLVGDDLERDELSEDIPLGAAARLDVDLVAGRARVTSSVTGLPPIFMDDASGQIALGASLDVLRRLRLRPLELEPQSIVDLFHTGFPLGWRTLFQNVTIVPASTRVQLQGGSASIESTIPLASHAGFGDGVARVERQVELFRESARAMNVSESVLSLSGGLDTRAIFSELVARTSSVPAVTMSGSANLGLDARIARALCRHYGLRHEIISLGAEFLSRLPDYARRASLLSGGLASISQAHEVYMAERIALLGARRISGNLGNQIGRQGVEGVSLRGADLSILSGEARVGTSVSSRHWIAEAVDEMGGRFFDALIMREVPFSSVGNYSIGHAFSVQQSPYAARKLIAYSAAHAAPATFEPSLARKRDLHHRFLGPPLAHSFQRQAIALRGGYASRYPINWGWRAVGGVSLTGLIWGGASLVDALSGRLHIPAVVARRARVAGLHETRPLEQWIDAHLREFITDTLRSTTVAQSGWFETVALRRLVDSHFTGTQRDTATLVAATDLALAIEVFTRSTRPASIA